ncbi:PEP/pyruvate-binding domain-containing protein [Streptococcus moroccensis]|uniref:Pyruvate,water dikinase n=1 Tax=Streptococcus moroccensis TaxID=1451356 RepID=A0ABT9YRJ3_9STRE|nr:PEP/pyruvate-binding domain-containing protein [Streptococcus moroccensis]MDQ0222390.1 pyruvate,water dikinase [Streptococcus moroccensis]
MENLITENTPQPSFGGKANGLISIQGLGYAVPEALLFPEEELTALWQPIVLSRFPRDSWGRLRPKEVLTCLEDLPIPQSLSQAWASWHKADRTYIVRSSALHEDGQEHSFAGQYDSFGGCENLETVWSAIKQCIASLFQDQVQAYWERLGMAKAYQLALLIQEELHPDFSGVCFTTAPEGQSDTRMLIEVVEGNGSSLVDGYQRPEFLTLDWFFPKFESSVLTISQQQQLHTMGIEVMANFGHPMDIEFAFVGECLYLLQARPITELPLIVASGSWTTTNFRDGGVSASSSPPLMRWLYQRVWQASLSQFMIEAGLFKPFEIGSLSIVRFSRLYWNLGQVKKAMAKIPGYVEADFDDELGVAKYYEGMGEVTPWRVKQAFHLAGIAWRIRQMNRHHQTTIEKVFEDAQSHLEQLVQELSHMTSYQPTADLEKWWLQLTQDIHSQYEGLYFRQVFLNTVLLAMKKTALLKKVSLEDFFILIEDLGQLSHTDPLRAIANAVQADDSEKAFLDFKERFGYHSSRELDLLTPSYEEDMTPIREQVAYLSQNREAFESFQKRLAPKVNRDEDLEAIYSKLSTGQTKRVKAIVQELRDLLWWREALKDVSTKTYHLIRKGTLALGEHYVKQGLLEQAEDLFFLTPEDLVDPSTWQERIRNEKTYYKAYQQFRAPNDLRADQVRAIVGQTALKGRGANHGIATARVRVLKDLSDISLIQSGEILVTPYTDTGWSYAFGQIAGLVTEYGGVLSHASIVARECGIPAIVCAVDATKHLKTGMRVTINGTSGEIMIIEEEV